MKKQEARQCVNRRLLCPWDSPGKNTGVGCHFLLLGVFLTQGSNPGLVHCRQILYWLSHQGSPSFFFFNIYFIMYLAVQGLNCGMQIFSCGMWDVVP